MKAYVVITVARQIEGEYCFVRTEKGFRNAGAADNLLKKLKNDFSANGVPKVTNLSTPMGEHE
jgi:hypothetical protein